MDDHGNENGAYSKTIREQAFFMSKLAEVPKEGRVQHSAVMSPGQ